MQGVATIQTRISLSKCRPFSGSALKLIAVISMLIDHFAFVFGAELGFMTSPLFTLGQNTITLYYIMRKVGRLAFPLFCFLVAEGMVHTRKPIWYGVRLLVFALISEIPFNLMHGGNILYLSKQNVYFTLFLGAMLIWAFEHGGKEWMKMALMAAIMVIARFLRADYGMPGVFLILLLHVTRKHAAAQAILAYPLLSGGVAAFAAFIPINLYNGQRGFVRSQFVKFVFYAFYPLHILLLAGIKMLLTKT